MSEPEIETDGYMAPSSVDLDGDPAWAYVCDRPAEAKSQGLMVALNVAQTTGTCDMGETHGIVATQNLSAPEARKLAAALLNAADELDRMQA